MDKMTSEMMGEMEVKNLSMNPSEYNVTPTAAESNRLQKYNPRRRRKVEKKMSNSSSMTLYQDIEINTINTTIMG
jgi:hypothetical protein